MLSVPIEAHMFSSSDIKSALYLYSVRAAGFVITPPSTPYRMRTPTRVGSHSHIVNPRYPWSRSRQPSRG